MEKHEISRVGKQKYCKINYRPAVLHYLVKVVAARDDHDLWCITGPCAYKEAVMPEYDQLKLNRRLSLIHKGGESDVNGRK